MKSLAFFLVASALWAEPQLILMTGSQNTKGPAEFPNLLLRIGPDGTVAETNVHPDDPGAFFIDASNDARRIVLLTPGVGASVVDMDSGKLAKACPPPDWPAGTVQVAEWLVDVPAVGVALVERFVEPGNAQHPIYRAMSTDPSVPCAQSFVKVPESDLKRFLSEGDTGVAGTASNESTSMAIVENGEVVYLFRLYIGYQIPPSDRPGPKDFFRGIVNDSQMFVGAVAYISGEAGRLVVYRKRDKKWISLQVPGDTAFNAHAFGSYLATPELRYPSEAYRESAGKEEWRSGVSRTGVDVADAISHSSIVYPGRLHVFDIDTEKRYTIETKQADSEVLLIEAGTIYYRASDRLYSVAIRGDSLGTPKLLATNELIRDAHWAFVRR